MAGSARQGSPELQSFATNFTKTAWPRSAKNSCNSGQVFLVLNRPALAPPIPFLLFRSGLLLRLLWRWRSGWQTRWRSSRRMGRIICLNDLLGDYQVRVYPGIELGVQEGHRAESLLLGQLLDDGDHFSADLVPGARLPVVEIFLSVLLQSLQYGLLIRDLVFQVVPGIVRQFWSLDF